MRKAFTCGRAVMRVLPCTFVAVLVTEISAVVLTANRQHGDTEFFDSRSPATLVGVLGAPPTPFCGPSDSDTHGTFHCGGANAERGCPESGCNYQVCQLPCSEVYVLFAGVGYTYSLKAVNNPTCENIGSKSPTGRCDPTTCECVITDPNVPCPAALVPAPGVAIIKC